jgi:type I restriction enzyme M protein
MNDKYISIPKLAELLGVTRQAIQKRLVGKINSGEVKVKTEGNTYLIEISTLPEEIREDIKDIKHEGKRIAEKLLSKSDGDLNIEKELWSAADKLRGNVDSSNYKHIVLGLIFLKYVSDAYYHIKEDLTEKLSDVKGEYYIGNEKTREKVIDDPDQYKKERAFYIPENARWEYLQSKAAMSDIAKHIDDAMDSIEEANPQQLTGVLPKEYVRSNVDHHTLGELVNIFSKIDFSGDVKKEKDTLGRVYEYFLGQFADSEGKRGGEFYTPRSLVKLLTEVLEPYENSRVLDPACGSGGMFVQSSKFLQEHHKDPTKIAIYGQENNQTTLRLCKMNLAIRGVFGDIQLGNTYYDDKFPNLKFDFVLANPPFNAEWNPERLSDKDPRINYGMPPKGNANFLWIQHF